MQVHAPTVEHQDLKALDQSGRLYNEDLAPATADNRHWNSYSLFSLWMNDAHNVGNYTFAAGLFLLGLSPWQVTLGILGGCLVIWAGCTMSGFMGQVTGTPYPVVSRISWGVWGANFPALVRGIVAIGWYGIQTYLASVALQILLVRFIPGLKGLEHTNFVGLSLLGWLAFLILWVLQLAVIVRGMEAVRHLQGWAGPAVWVAMLSIAGWMLWQAHFDISWTKGGKVLSTGDQVYQTFAAVGLTIGVLATLMLNFSDFARFAPNKQAVIRGNFWGLPINWTAFSLTSVIVSAATVKVYGSAVLEPTLLLNKVHNNIIVLIGALVFVVATVGVNIVANFVSPAYDLANVWPKYITFKRGGIITAFLALLTVPWKLYSSPQAISYFLGGLGALLGPFFGIMAVDFFLIRRQRVLLADLYTPTPASAYYYRKGINPLAVIAFVPAAAVSLTFALVPAFDKIAPFGWFIGCALGALIYYPLARRRIGVTPAAPAYAAAG
jgi:NCS1 family nucleobase:cation symporter-1